MEIDRLAELRRSANYVVDDNRYDDVFPTGQTNGTTSTPKSSKKAKDKEKVHEDGTIVDVENVGAGSDEVTDKVDQYKPIEQGVSRIEASTVALEALKIRNQKAISERQRKGVMNELDVIINETNQESMKIKRTLDANRPRHGGAAGSAKAQIESNMYATYTRKFHDVMVRYNRVANEFKQQNRNRDARMLRTIDPSIDDQRAEEIVDSGQVSQILSQALVSDDLQDAVRGIEERHVEILKLEQQVIGINELFKDLATLVDLQQESLDVIENRIIHAENYAKKGEEELDSAAIYAAKARRRMCIFCFCILILGLILLAVLTPIFTTVIHSATNN